MFCDRRNINRAIQRETKKNNANQTRATRALYMDGTASQSQKCEIKYWRILVHDTKFGTADSVRLSISVACAMYSRQSGPVVRSAAQARALANLKLHSWWQDSMKHCLWTDSICRLDVIRLSAVCFIFFSFSCFVYL